MKGDFDFGTGRTLAASDLKMSFWANNASFPYKSHDKWFITENIRWGKFAESDLAMVDKVNRSDLWKAAAEAMGQKALIPASDDRGAETFFDGIKFEASNPKAYLDSLKIKKA
jgi:nitrate/nitrite transport system substrate-binding protein